MNASTTEAGKPFRRLLLTGAAGNLGCQLRGALAGWADIVRVSDVAPLGDAAAHEEVRGVDLADRQAVMALVDGVDAIVHFGGISVDAPFDDLLEANIRGTYNLYEAARKHGVKRIVFASSNHAIGFHPVTEVLDADSPQRPDSLYGVTKCFGEALSRYYFDRFGIETVCVRIGSSFEAPKNPRMLVTYLSYRDLIELVRCALLTNRVGHVVVYGMSDNPVKWWDNTKAGFLGFRPRDSSEPFAGRFPLTAPTADYDDPAQRYQGGGFVLGEPMERRE
ncbi:NAD(P)-dependent oxidoreductase [Burkholderia stagnalis]|uniref:NAD-dependent epimerase/dehydratase family protein n=1 Tax=Burkholderia stagnalis TaxID=1503054 RepID=UPI000F56CD96|nr:NAD(P)-dependent oxidoreductase [Burkholderia stagnalis]RQQ06100.1 NAD(P)-dependent oxidoreductase [Burkholderia stagnalis]RQQ15098.1 NAD(P)-dependent oxidoreductase [Burkholderia stagnalis]RQQ30171.1 NAD(P)-dependent oxidoreductase [Burkholderia stagnalis]RQQ32898.1 NAD(P)-dependent oxidoreductase [Burkholderia stagnalis]RQQ35166.1 NAD(P)-dependent oxidoreductase [Burkholderia stagnalis]